VALRDTARALEAVPEAALTAAAEAIVDLAEQVGGRTMGVPLSATYRITGRGAAAEATIHGKPTAFWVWKNDGTSAHVIGTRRGGRALLLEGAAHPIAPPVVHPGTSGRGAWRQVARAAEHLAPDAVADAVHGAVA
jgi:hypothetical protein